MNKPILPRGPKHEHYVGMIARFRNLLLAGVLGWTSLMPAPVKAQDPVQTELAALRKSIDEQKDEIARLKNEVAHLAALLDNPRRIDPAVAASGAAPAVVATPGGGAPAAAAGAGAATEAPRPNIVPPANVHVIVKGDSLDKIAKQHGVSITELQKLNKISDPKKLQIGQQLILPPSADKGEKKDTPPPQ